MRERRFHRRSGGHAQSQRRPANFSRPTPAPREDLIYGRRPVFEAFEAGKRAIHKLWVVRGTGGGIVERTLELARERGVPVEWTRWEWLDGLVYGHHQGIAAQASAMEFHELDDFVAKLGPSAPAVLVALDEIQDPQNVGAILRSAGFFGAAGLIVPRWRSAPIGDAAMRVASGAAERVPLIRVRNLSDALLQLREAGFGIVGADADGEPLASFRPPSRCVLVLGNEGSGLRRLVRERCDKLLGIPRRGPIDSLNVGAAAAIFLNKLLGG